MLASLVIRVFTCSVDCTRSNLYMHDVDENNVGAFATIYTPRRVNTVLLGMAVCL